MPSAEILTIGTEILLGDILDTNAQYLARCFRQDGIDLFRETTIGDNTTRIAAAVREALARNDIVLTTGGLGPTVDDATRQAIAESIGVELEFREELWVQIQERFRRFGRTPTQNNRQQAYVPQGSLSIINPVGTAPAFILEMNEKCIISLPGVPREMEYLMENSILPYLRRRYQLTGIILSRVLHTVGIGESIIDERISDLEKLTNPTVGLAAHSGQVDVRITAKSSSSAQAEDLIRPVEVEIRQRLGGWIYGIDDETLESVALGVLERRGWSMVAVEAGLKGELVQRLLSVSGPFLGGEMLPTANSPEYFKEYVRRYHQHRQADVCLGTAVFHADDRQEIYLVVITPYGLDEYQRPYGGPREYVARWALHHGLDLIRKLEG